MNQNIQNSKDAPQIDIIISIKISVRFLFFVDAEKTVLKLKKEGKSK